MRDKRLPVFFVRGEQVLALKSSSLRGNVLLSTAFFVSGEVLIGARAKRALLMRPSSVKDSISTVCKLPGTSLSHH